MRLWAKVRLREPGEQCALPVVATVVTEQGELVEGVEVRDVRFTSRGLFLSCLIQVENKVELLIQEDGNGIEP